MGKPTVMVVDDDELTQELICGILGDDYTLVRAASGNECMQMLEQGPTDILLLDVNMPGIDGLEACRLIRKNPAHHNLSIIFVSASDAKDEIIAGYEAGADDYITKPLHSDSLLARVERNTRLHLKRKSMVSDEYVERDEIQRIKSLIVPLVQFVELSQSANFHDAVIEKLFNFTQQLNLSCRVQARVHQQIQYFADDGMLRPIEANLLEQMHGQGQCCEFGKRLIINFSDVSLLVRNMPTENDGLRENLILAITQAVHIANAKINALNHKDDRQKQIETLAQVLESATETVGFLHQQFCDHTRKSHEVHDSVTHEISKNLEALGLTDEQEDFLNQVIDRGMQQLVALSNESVIIENNINAFALELRESLRKHMLNKS